MKCQSRIERLHVPKEKAKSDNALSCTYRIQCLTQRFSSRIHCHSRLFCLWLNFGVFSHVKWSFTLPKDTKYQLNAVYSQFDTGRQFDYCLCTAVLRVLGTCIPLFFSFGHYLGVSLRLVFGHRTYTFRCDICFSIFGHWVPSTDTHTHAHTFFSGFRGVAWRVPAHIKKGMNIALAVIH